VDVRWSEYRDQATGNATVREAIDASPHRETFMAALAGFSSQVNRHERIDVHWWGAPFIYINVIDGRREDPVNHRAMVSFDLTNGEFYSWRSSRRYGFARRGWVSFMERLTGGVPTYSDKTTEQTLAELAATEAGGPVVLTGIPQVFSAFKRYHLSNGWFIDGATRSHAYHGGHKYTVYEPGGHPSGCAGLRGAAPTLALAVAVANGQQPCGLAYAGCRKLAIGYHIVPLSRGREGRSYYCEDHAPKPAIQVPEPTVKVAGSVTIAVTGPAPERKAISA
jgi:hypothetical protein